MSYTVLYYGLMNCPDCGHPMHKAGHAWSGRRRVQRWKCDRCGRTTVKQPKRLDT